MEDVGAARSEFRTAIAADAEALLPDSCRLVADGEEYEDVPCRLRGAGGDIEGAPYTIEFAWGSPAVIGADVVVEASDGRPQITLQLVAPVDSATSFWQEWRATSGPGLGRVDVGL